MAEHFDACCGKNGNADEEIEEATAKRLKAEESPKSIHESMKDLSGISFDKIIGENASSKSVFLRCLVGEDEKSQAVVVLEKRHFSENDVRNILSPQTTVRQELHNDVYGTYFCNVPSQFNGIQATIIHPATDKHVDKFCSKPFHLVVETSQDYADITVPWIQASQFSLQWVENILNHTSEADRIVFEDTDPNEGFILLPDLKWNRERIEELYLVAIVHRRGLLSLRDLNQEHLPLLRNIRDRGLKAIKDTYGVGAHQLRVFLHYHPSYYHLHVHFTHLRAEGAAASASVHVERAHLLESVINILESCPGYYQNSSLTFAVKEGEPLWQKFQETGKFNG